MQLDFQIVVVAVRLQFIILRKELLDEEALSCHPLSSIQRSLNSFERVEGLGFVVLVCSYSVPQPCGLSYIYDSAISDEEVDMGPWVWVVWVEFWAEVF